MRSVFVSFPFRPNNTVLRDHAVRLIESFDLRVITGQSLGGGALQASIFKLVDSADALIAFFAKTDKLEKSGWGSTAWVKDEFAHAKGREKPCIALVEQGVKHGGAYAADEYIPFKRSDPAGYLLRLAETLGTWKRQAGRVLKIQILPDEVATSLGLRDVQCKYRFYVPATDTRTSWRVANVVSEPGGVFAYLRGFSEESLLEVEVSHGPTLWRSRATSGWSQVEVVSVGGAT